MNSKALNKNNGVLKRVAVLISLALLFSIMAIPVHAAVNGDLTFYHGINQSQKYTYGRTTSTAVENNMYFTGKIHYDSGPYTGLTITTYSNIGYNTRGLQMTIYPGSVLGSSFFYYYVDSSFQHASTAWWNFDFR